MCASYESRFTVRQLVDAFSAAGTPFHSGVSLPNLAEVDEVRPTDRSAVVMAGPRGEAIMASLSFGFPPPRPKARPVVNLRGEGRVFQNGDQTGRCLVPMTGFYEFTGSTYPKTRWVFRDPEAPLLCLAAVWRAGESGAAESFALLTSEPGPDIAPYHDRAVVIAPPKRWADWLAGDVFPADMIQPAPSGTVIVSAAPRPPKGD
ncbi:MAG TPA: SOS response-associated peptidase family protein [Brevundimonas sp.]|jgi:putative SOS response-associated peptidase YedK